MMDWRLIDTAPRTIEFRCLLAHRFSVVTGYWDGDGWVNERSRHADHFAATHWMPLPAPPLSDADLIKAYQESGGEAGDPRADELAREIERRGLDL